MELLIWHEALGSDDEQATEDELIERILYAYSTTHASLSSVESVQSDAGMDLAQQTEQQLQTLNFM